VLLVKQDIRSVIDALPEPTKSIVTLVVVGSLRVGEVTALRWERIQPDESSISLTARSFMGPRSSMLPSRSGLPFFGVHILSSFTRSTPPPCSRKSSGPST